MRWKSFVSNFFLVFLVHHHIYPLGIRWSSEAATSSATNPACSWAYGKTQKKMWKVPKYSKIFQLFFQVIRSFKYQLGLTIAFKLNCKIFKPNKLGKNRLQSDPDLTAPDLAAPRFNGRINFPRNFF